MRHITGDRVHSWAEDEGFLAGRVVKCQDCHFLCKYVRPSSAYFHQHYANAGEDYIERLAEEDPRYREDFRVARELLRKAFPKGGSILDVGCASGFFLETLGENWNRHGLELFHLAAERARKRAGISVSECDIGSAGFADRSFDVVSAFDVIEHLAEPMVFFRAAQRMLKPGGWLLLGTGNAGSVGALMSGSRWTYFCIPEHVSFFSPRSLMLALQKSGLSCFRIKRIHHGERNTAIVTAWLRAVGKHWAVTICGDRVTRLRLFRQKTSEFLVPYFFDHMICIARAKKM